MYLQIVIVKKADKIKSDSLNNLWQNFAKSGSTLMLSKPSQIKFQTAAVWVDSYSWVFNKWG